MTLEAWLHWLRDRVYIYACYIQCWCTISLCYYYNLCLVTHLKDMVFMTVDASAVTDIHINEIWDRPTYSLLIRQKGLYIICIFQSVSVYIISDIYGAPHCSHRPSCSGCSWDGKSRQWVSIYWEKQCFYIIKQYGNILLKNLDTYNYMFGTKDTQLW